MQIRERRTTWALIRTVYDKARKRGVARCLGTVSKMADQVPPAIAAQLSDAERQQIDALLLEARWARETSRREQSARNLPQSIARATEWYLDPRTAASNLAGLAYETREEFSRLLAAMVKAGVGRTRNRQSRAKERPADGVTRRRRPG